MYASPIPYNQDAVGEGVLIGRQGLTAHAAYARLRAQARAERRKLAIVSAEVVRSAVRLNRETVRENRQV